MNALLVENLQGLVLRPSSRHEGYRSLRYALPERVKDAIEGTGCSLPCPERSIRLKREELAA